MGKVITLAQAAPENALEGLNRITGLTFEQWPESLLTPDSDSAMPIGDSSAPTAADTRQTVMLAPIKRISGR